VLPEAQRDGILGDLREVHASRTADRGRLRAWLWFWAQTLPLMLAFARERLRDRASPVVWPTSNAARPAFASARSAEP
jgi:hypothetical protein